MKRSSTILLIVQSIYLDHQALKIQNMGNQQNIELQEWETVSKNDMYTVKRNPKGLQIEEYSFIIPNKDSLKLLEDDYRLRKSRHIQQDNVVDLLDFRVNQVPSMCSTSYNLVAITERIPKRLNEIHGIKQEHGIYLLHQMLNGYQKLSDNNGCAYEINPSMVGLNTQSTVKVWLNSNFGKTEPQSQLIGPQHSRADHEHQLINTLFQMTEGVLEGKQFPVRFKNAKCSDLPKPYRFCSTKEFIKDYADGYHPDLLMDDETEMYESKSEPLKNRVVASGTAVTMPDGKLSLKQVEHKPAPSLANPVSQKLQNQRLQKKINQMFDSDSFFNPNSASPHSKSSGREPAYKAEAIVFPKIQSRQHAKPVIYHHELNHSPAPSKQTYKPSSYPPDPTKQVTSNSQLNYTPLHSQPQSYSQLHLKPRLQSAYKPQTLRSQKKMPGQLYNHQISQMQQIYSQPQLPSSVQALSQYPSQIPPSQMQLQSQMPLSQMRMIPPQMPSSQIPPPQMAHPLQIQSLAQPPQIQSQMAQTPQIPSQMAPPSQLPSQMAPPFPSQIPPPRLTPQMAPTQHIPFQMAQTSQLPPQIPSQMAPAQQIPLQMAQPSQLPPQIPSQMAPAQQIPLQMATPQIPPQLQSQMVSTPNIPSEMAPPTQLLSQMAPQSQTAPLSQMAPQSQLAPPMAPPSLMAATPQISQMAAPPQISHMAAPPQMQIQSQPIMQLPSSHQPAQHKGQSQFYPYQQNRRPSQLIMPSAQVSTPQPVQIQPQVSRQAKSNNQAVILPNQSQIETQKKTLPTTTYNQSISQPQPIQASLAPSLQPSSLSMQIPQKIAQPSLPTFKTIQHSQPPQIPPQSQFPQAPLIPQQPQPQQSFLQSQPQSQPQQAQSSFWPQAKKLQPQYQQPLQTQSSAYHPITPQQQLSKVSSQSLPIQSSISVAPRSILSAQPLAMTPQSTAKPTPMQSESASSSQPLVQPLSMQQSVPPQILFQSKSMPSHEMLKSMSQQSYQQSSQISQESVLPHPEATKIPTSKLQHDSGLGDIRLSMNYSEYDEKQFKQQQQLPVPSQAFSKRAPMQPIVVSQTGQQFQHQGGQKDSRLLVPPLPLRQ